MKLTEHFTKEEMERSSTAIRLGIDNTCPMELLSNMIDVANHLEVIRAHFGKPIHVTSCYRSDATNRAVGGSPTSAHRFAFAADFEVQGVSNLEVCKWVAENMKGYDQIIYEFGEQGWCHLGFSHRNPREQKLSAVKVGGRTVYKDGLA
jgi:hypothetical protein